MSAGSKYEETVQCPRPPCAAASTQKTTAGLNFRLLSCYIPYSYHSSVYLFKTSFTRSDVFVSSTFQFVTTATKAASMSSAPFERTTLPSFDISTFIIEPDQSHQDVKGQSVWPHSIFGLPCMEAGYHFVYNPPPHPRFFPNPISYLL